MERSSRLYYRVRDIVAMTGMSKGKVLSAIKSGRLACLKLDGVLLIPVGAFDDWVGAAVPHGAKREDQAAG